MLKLGVHKTFKGEKLYKEVWKDIVGYEGFYQISNIGRVRSLDRIIKYRDGRVNHTKGRIIKPFINTTGYKTVLLIKERSKKHKLIHRLIAEMFIPNPYNKPCIDHINRVRTDNRIQNLRWVTHKENMNNELTKKHLRVAHRGRKATEETKMKLREINTRNKRVLCVETGIVYISTMEAGRQTQICPSSIVECCNGKRKSAGKFHWRYL